MLQSSGVNLEFCELKLNEIQSDSIEEIAFEKSNSAYKQLYRPVIVEDDGLFIDELNGFPGQYSSYVYKTIENK
jgi:XTP/dITP diphosphohydrolase